MVFERIEHHGELQLVRSDCQREGVTRRRQVRAGRQGKKRSSKARERVELVLSGVVWQSGWLGKGCDRSQQGVCGCWLPHPCQLQT